ncbi:endopolygalacturonase [Pseudomassariella vexata]|uniref:endo-polygalacturonase n=1 Tax=Pseudomassariella vexata TaxID=1141098 RepID=A0A1Y2DB50_9PEZI|nr:endopolygalacturonase [Pseudomassariella vexata]ORY56346.1 endopolygalacturonase [Pseudomassariella vexata]
MLSNIFLCICALASFATATPTLTAVAQLNDRASTTCTFTDAAKAKSGKTSCTTIYLKDIVVPAGTTLDLTGLKAGTHVIFQGKTTFGYKEWSGPLISFSGTNILIEGASGHSIDADGARWWDSKGTNGGKTKPKFFYAHKLINSNIKGLSVKNTPVQGFSINGAQNLAVYDVTIDNSAGDSAGGHNTDAFDVGSSTGVYISGATIKNQDDCLAINSGTNITFTGGYCSGGHGLSIGSVGGRSNNVVKSVKITNSQIVNSDNGVRIKTVYGATGSVSDITYSDIKLTNIAKYGIVIEQDYENGSPTGTPTAGVPITGLKVSKVTGTVMSSGNDIYVLCAKGACSNWAWSGVNITGGKKSTKCTNVPSSAAC